MDRTRQRLEETEQDRKTRLKGAFPQTEHSLPIIGSRLGIPFIDSITSYLTYAGLRNPFASEARPSVEVVWLLDNTAYRPSHLPSRKPKPWQAEFLVAYFKKNTGRDISKIVASIADKLGLGEDEPAAKTIAERLQPFADSIAPARSVRVKLPSGVVQKIAAGGPSAVSVQTVAQLGEHEDGDTSSISAIPQELAPYGPMTTFFAAPEGWAVISGTAHFHPTPSLLFSSQLINPHIRQTSMTRLKSP